MKLQFWKRQTTDSAQPPTIGLRDLLYFDFDRAASIYSQLTGGLVKEIQDAIESSSGRTGRLGVNAQVLGAERTSSVSEKVSRLESRVLHHDLLVRLEDELFKRRLAVDLNNLQPDDAPDIRDYLRDAPYVRAEGLAVVEDYPALKDIVSSMNDLISLIRNAALSQFRNSGEYQSLTQLVDEARDKLRKAHAKKPLQDQVRAIEEQIRQLEEKVVSVQPLEEWLTDGIELWVDTFMKDKATIRLYPYKHLANFLLFGNLKRDSFLEDTVESVLFAYGSRPNVRLTMLGLVTSMVPEREDPEDPRIRADDEEVVRTDDTRGQQVQMARAFQKAFRGMQVFESLARPSDYYPNVTVYPLAVYRSITEAEAPGEAPAGD